MANIPTNQKLWHVFGVVWSCFVYNKTTYICKTCVCLFLDNITLEELVVSFCYLSVISDICEPCLGRGEGYQYPVSLKQNRQISHILQIYFRSKAKNIPKNTQNDNAISHIPVIHMLSIKKNKHLVNIVVLYFESDLVSFVTKLVWVPTNNWALDRVYWDTEYLPFYF
jgi:hypothetical protein